MKNVMPSIIKIFAGLCLITGCNKNGVSDTTPSERYKDAIFTAVIKTTFQYDVQPDYLGNSIALFADVYQPSGDNNTSRALIIYVHGGGFTGGTRNEGNISYLCESLAKKGYVVASIDYRLGYANQSSASEYGQAIIRAVQDLNSFVRFTKHNALAYKIDTTRIFTSGGSAGAATALAAAFLDYNERPAFIDTTSVGSFSGRGNINGKSTKVKAVYSLWGAVADTTWIKAGDIPVGAIQSINDLCIPWNSVASSCQIPGAPTFGSNAISTRAKNSGIYTTVYGYNSDVHTFGLQFPQIDTTISKMSEFLLPLSR